MISGVLVSVLLLSGCSGGSTPAATPTPSISGVKVFSGLSHDHVDGSVDYPQTPPVGGKHNSSWLACGVYTEPVPNPTAVHSIEHGAIWVTYRPGLPAAEVATLGDVQQSNTQYVLVTPYDGLPSPIVVSTWGLQLQAQTATDPRIAEFVRTYAGGDQGNEEGAPCKTKGLTLAEAQEAVR